MNENNQIKGKLITPEMTFSGVYLIINVFNSKFYVGSAKNLRHRMRNHFNSLKDGVHKNIHLQRAYNKNPNAFIMVMIEKVENLDELTAAEQKWMDELNVTNKTVCYNILNVANNLLGFKHSEETRRKISEIQIGKKLSNEHRKNISDGLKGRTWKTNKPAKNRLGVIQMDLNGTEIKKWDSMMIAADTLGLQVSHISNCCYGKRKTHGRFTWKLNVNTN